MCGIAGIVGWNNSWDHRVTIERMAKALRHRGPDDEGYWTTSHTINEKKDFRVCFAHRRLSIIDLAGGHQPICNEDEKIWIVFNGEIYNFRTLHHILVQKGHIFKTATDTEVIVHAYEEYGINCLKYLNGMFSFAIWDDYKKRLFIARDRLGVKPLYYCFNGSLFVFASELKSLLASGLLAKDINMEAINLYCFFGYIPSPYSILKSVKKLEAAHYVVYDTKSILCKKYWSLSQASSIENKNIRIQTAAKEFKELFFDAVKIRLISDVPLGAFLSGGIDSSAVTCAMAKMCNKPVETFSIGFHSTDFTEHHDAEKVANNIGAKHHNFFVEPAHVDILDDLAWYLDEPFADSSALPTYYLAKMTRKYVKVALSGDGGDELFGGYSRYLKTHVEIAANFLPDLLKSFLSFIGEKLPENAKGKYFLIALRNDCRGFYKDKIGCFPDLRSALFLEPLRQFIGHEDEMFALHWSRQSKNLQEQMSKFDFYQYLPDDILVKVDRMTMAFGLEARSPFLDYRLAEFAFALPECLKINRGNTKYLLKYALKDLLPEFVLQKSKQGFAVPLKHWFRQDLNNFANEILLDRKTLHRGYFDPKGIRNILKMHNDGDRDFSRWIWTLLMLELWHRVFKI